MGCQCAMRLLLIVSKGSDDVPAGERRLLARNIVERNLADLCFVSKFESFIITSACSRFVFRSIPKSRHAFVHASTIATSACTRSINVTR